MVSVSLDPVSVFQIDTEGESTGSCTCTILQSDGNNRFVKCSKWLPCRGLSSLKRIWIPLTEDDEDDGDDDEEEEGDDEEDANEEEASKARY